MEPSSCNVSSLSLPLCRMEQLICTHRYAVPNTVSSRYFSPLILPFTKHKGGKLSKRGSGTNLQPPKSRASIWSGTGESQEVECQTFPMFATNCKTSPNDPKRSKSLLDTKQAEITSRRDYLVKHRPTSGTPFRQKIPGGKLSERGSGHNFSAWT